MTVVVILMPILPFGVSLADVESSATGMVLHFVGELPTVRSGTNEEA